MSTVATEGSLPALVEFADRYLAAWHRHDVEAIIALHTPDSVLTSVATGREARGRQGIAQALAEIFAVWPDLSFVVNRRYVTPELIVTESTARATQAVPLTIAGESIQPNGRVVEFAVADIFPIEAGLIKRKDSYVDGANYVRLMREPRD
jgi:steroid delta-isomerase-like uncharacterized protein